MKFESSIPVVQSCQYADWDILHSPELSLEWLHELLDSKLPVRKKDDANVLTISESSLVLKRDSDVGCLVAKLNRKLNYSDMIKHPLQANAAKKSWHYAHLLINQGFLTAEPLAYINKTKMGISQESWYVCRFVEGIGCDNYFINTGPFTPSMIITTSAIVEMFIDLRKSKLSHGNLKASNILIANNAPILIDLSSMNYHSNELKAEQLWREDIDNFMDNWWQRYDIDRQFRLAFSKHGIKL